MDGLRVQKYWSNEVDALLQTYRQFETLIPSRDGAGSAHSGEDGRFVEDLLREYLVKYLPAGLEVLTGFILRAAVRTGESGKERRDERDCSSSQLDIIVYDSVRYPIYQRFGNSVVVPPEGVVAIISVKKHLRNTDVARECGSLLNAALLCRTIKSNEVKDKVRGPYLALVSMGSGMSKSGKEALQWLFNKVSSEYEVHEDLTYDCAVGYIGVLDSCSLIKQKPRGKLGASDVSANYVGFVHREDESHLGLQYLLSGILSVYYDETRSAARRPGFTAFPSNRAYDKKLGSIKCSRLR